MSIKFFFLILIILLFPIFTGCSDLIREDELIIQGQVRIPDICLFTAQNSDNTVDQLHINTTPSFSTIARSGEYIVKFNRDFSEEYINQVIFGEYDVTVKKIADDNTYKIKINGQERVRIQESLGNNPHISHIEPNYLVHIQDYIIPDDPDYIKQWGLKMLELERTWQSTRGSNTITVAVVDTGVLPDHPDLKDNLISGYDFVDDDSDPTDPNPDFSHGTHVAGIIGAVTNNQQGIAGINWQVRIMPIRVIESGGSGGYDALISGIYEAVNRGADIINLSLGGSVDSPTLHEAIKYAVNNGVTVVAAVGNHTNNNSPSILYPACYPEVISVGAVGPTGERAFYSNYGPEIDLVAPGGDSSVSSVQNNTILSTAGYMKTGNQIHQYTYAQGTSMATPHVSGLVALLYSTGYHNPPYILNLLKNTADDLGPVGPDDEYGAGLININRALNLVNESKSIKIFAIKKEDGQEKGEIITTTDSSGRFSLKLSPGYWSIRGWLDTNDDEEINSGDYYGENPPLKIEEDSYNIFIELELNKT